MLGSPVTGEARLRHIGVMICASALLAGCAIPPNELEIIHQHPESGLVMVRSPSASAILRVYPEAARLQAVTGDVALICVLNADGDLTLCVVQSEAPAGRGFGEAALKVAPEVRMAPIRPSARMAGMRVLVPIHFKLH